jgi:hypothetical protein
MVIPAGSGAGHAAPTTPPALVNVIAVSVAVPVIAAVPLQTVLFAAVPVNVTCPSTAEPLIVAVTCPLQLTDVDAHVPRTSDPDCVRSSLTCSVELFDDAIVPSQVPATFIVVPADTELGAVELPAHAAQLTVTARITAKRIFIPSIDVVKDAFLCASFAPMAAPRTDAHGRAARDGAGALAVTILSQAARDSAKLDVAQPFRAARRPYSRPEGLRYDRPPEFHNAL